MIYHVVATITNKKSLIFLTTIRKRKTNIINIIRNETPKVREMFIDILLFKEDKKQENNTFWYIRDIHVCRVLLNLPITGVCTVFS